MSGVRTSPSCFLSPANRRASVRLAFAFPLRLFLVSYSRQQEQRHVVERVRPRGDAKPPQQIQRREEQPGDHAENEGIDLETVAVGTEVVECREDAGADYRRGDARSA